MLTNLYIQKYIEENATNSFKNLSDIHKIKSQTSRFKIFQNQRWPPTDDELKPEYIQYGPLNVEEPGDYWKDIAEYWNTTEEAAKKSLCGNCVAFDISPRMDECMPGKTSDKDGRLGYCWMHHFKCHSARSCRTWAKGGPITKDSVSYDWQERNKNKV